MPKIDNITYPEESLDMLADQHIGPMYRAYLDKKHCEWTYRYIDEAMKKRDPKAQFKKFFAENAKFAINVSGESLSAARRFAAAKDWKNKGWKEVYDLADTLVLRVANGEHDSIFYQKDEAFKKHHIYMLEKRMLRQKYPALLTELNTADKKAVANVAALLQSDKGRGTKAVKALAKKNKVTKKVPDLVKLFKKTFKISG
ncbi:MAG: hypothetical protein AAF252_02660 [Pseudomonadota bacterium]